MSIGSSSRPSQSRVHALLSGAHVDDINIISDFVSQPSFPLEYQVDTIYILAGNAILPTTASLFNHLTLVSEKATFLITGGIGHSTSFLYDAVQRHRLYSSIHSSITGLPEAVVLQKLLYAFWPELAEKTERGNVKLLIESQSTNCGANAVESKRILDQLDIWPKRLVIVQDPTMNRRTLAGFQKIYSEDPRALSIGMPLLHPFSFTPTFKASASGPVSWRMEELAPLDITEEELWTHDRFVSLIVGEIPRMRDDAGGYGPKGAGYIVHVDIPDEVEMAWTILNRVLIDPDPE